MKHAKLVSGCLCLMPTGSSYGREHVKALFVGNSQMMVCGVPQMVGAMSESAPADHPRIEVGQALIGGSSLKTHWDSGPARSMIATGQWDHVVIQEIYAAGRESFEAHATLFDEAIRQAGATPILFATASVTPHYSSTAAYRFPDSTLALNDMQIAFGRRKGIRVAAAGYAWLRYLGPDPSDERVFDLYAADRGHPGQKGSYIYACLLYATITGRNPAGLTGAFAHIGPGIAISPEEAAGMQQAAWEQCREDGQR